MCVVCLVLRIIDGTISVLLREGNESIVRYRLLAAVRARDITDFQSRQVVPSADVCAFLKECRVESLAGPLAKELSLWFGLLSKAMQD
jgi:hypothetical protein